MKILEINNKNEFKILMIFVTTIVLFLCNIIVTKMYEFNGINFNMTIFLFPIIYIIGDIIAEFFKFKEALKIGLTAYSFNFILVILLTLIASIPTTIPSQLSMSFDTLFSFNILVLIASFLAYSGGIISNLIVFNKIRERFKDSLFFRCIGSTLVCEIVDSLIVYSIILGLTGLLNFTNIIIMCLMYGVMKTIWEILLYPVTKRAIGTIRKSEAMCND